MVRLVTRQKLAKFIVSFTATTKQKNYEQWLKGTVSIGGHII
jgi:hypothetical protein